MLRNAANQPGGEIPTAASKNNLWADMYIPEGYVSVHDAIKRLDVNWLKQGELTSTRDAQNAIGIGLASQKLRCFGIVDEKGVLVEIPSNHWRTSEGREIIENAGSLIASIGGKATHPILPIILEIDFGRLFPNVGDQSAKPPTIWPEGYENNDGDLPPAIKKEQLVLIAPQKNKGGRQEKYDWDAFWVEVVRFVDIHGLEPDYRVDCQKHMETWTATNWKEAPGKSTIRNKLLKLFAAPVTINK